MPYHGIYMSSVTATTGCNKQFSSTPHPTALLPPRVSLECDACSDTHNFRLVRTQSVPTPSQRVQFQKYCEMLGIEQDVEIEDK